MTVRSRVFELRPSSMQFDGRSMFQTPDDRLERLTITSGADGVATFPYFPTTIDPLTVRVTAPASPPITSRFRIVAGRDRITLKLGRPARLAGSVYNDSGQPANNVPIEVWVENTYSTWVGPRIGRRGSRQSSFSSIRGRSALGPMARS